MFKGIYIPGGKTPLIIGLVFGVLYYLIKYLFGEKKSAKITRLLIFSLSLYVSISLGSLTYNHWKWESLITSSTMMKIILIVLSVAIIHLNILYIRAEISYKRKRGNIRIQQEQPKNHVKSWLENRKKNGEELSIQLGVSTETEEKAPPI